MRTTTTKMAHRTMIIGTLEPKIRPIRVLHRATKTTLIATKTAIPKQQPRSHVHDAILITVDRMKVYVVLLHRDRPRRRILLPVRLLKQRKHLPPLRPRKRPTRILHRPSSHPSARARRLRSPKARGLQVSTPHQRHNRRQFHRLGHRLLHLRRRSRRSPRSRRRKAAAREPKKRIRSFTN